MDCREAREGWHRAHEVGSDDPAVTRHLAGCDRCRRYAADMRRLTTALAELREQTEPIRAQGTAGKPLARRTSLGALLRVAALIAIVAGAFAIVLNLRPSPIRPLRVEREPLPRPSDAIDARSQTAGVQPVRQPALGLTLRGESAQMMLAVAVPTAEPNVQMYWLYPTLRGDGSSRETGR